MTAPHDIRRCGRWRRRIWRVDCVASGQPQTARPAGRFLRSGALAGEFRRRKPHHPDELRRGRNLHALVAAFAGAMERTFRGGRASAFPTHGRALAGRRGETRLRESAATLKRCGIRHEVLERAALEERYPQMNLAGVARGLLEPESGVLLARRAVASVLEEATWRKTRFAIAQILTPKGNKPLEYVETSTGERYSAGQFVFACGPWLGKVFAELLGPRIFPTRQEVFFFGSPPGDARFAPPALPTWLFQADEVYGMPDIESAWVEARSRHARRAR